MALAFVCGQAAADGMKLGVGTSAVPHGGKGGGMIAVDGPNNDQVNGPIVQFTTDADDYPLMTIHPNTHDDMAIRFDSWFDPTQSGSARQKSSTASTACRLIKTSTHFKIQGADPTAANQTLSWSDELSINLESGKISLPRVPLTKGTGNVLYVAADGTLCYRPSSIRYKENVRQTKDEDTDWIYDLSPVLFDFKDKSLGLDQCGLIAEEVAAVFPGIVSFAPEQPILATADGDKTDAMPGSSPTEGGTLLPDSVQYDQLIVPLLAEVQQLRKTVDTLKAQMAELQAGK